MISNFIPKQKIVSKRLGGLRELSGRLSFYIGILNLLFTGSMNYYLVVKNILPINITVFIFVILGFLVIATFVDYVWIYPSHVAFTSNQFYVHDNPITKDLKLIKEKLGINENEK